MGVYNCDETLEEALDSLLNQTYQDFELILCDDGSVDKTFQIAQTYKNAYAEKIILLKNEQNQGLNATLNKCLKKAKGEYIARMDGDDVSLPERFKKQVQFLEKHPEYDLVSSAMTTFDETGDFGIIRLKNEPDTVDFIKFSPFNHAPCMARRAAFINVGGYSVHERLLRVEDWHLWIKMYVSGFKGYNLDEALYKMRDDRHAALRRNWKNRLNEFYVRYLAFKLLKLPVKYLPYTLRPIILGLLPLSVYRYLHKKKLEKQL